MRTILVTGHAGFIGSPSLRQAQDKRAQGKLSLSINLC